MKKIFDIIPDEALKEIKGDESIAITDLESDSRKIREGNCFVALKGIQVDGHNYINAAIENGASWIICEHMPSKIKSAVGYAIVKDLRAVLPTICMNFYDNPSEEVDIIGVTGTNGKTTVVNLLYELFSLLGCKCGLISTIENKVGDRSMPASHTTPDVISLNRLLRFMADLECEYVFMEVSSHAIDQNRIGGINFRGGVFTNLSHDHLDYHKTYKNYIYTKKKFFDMLAPESFAMTNADDKNGELMVQNTRAEVTRYGLHTMGDYKGKIIDNSLEGLHLNVDEVELHCRLIGKFNTYNILAAYGTAMNMGFEKQEVLVHISEIKPPEGRFQWMKNSLGVYGVIDYAHTPDALNNILQTLTEVKNKKAKIITVVGCGGNRDKAKRPKMAAIACALSDRVIVTTDNPRYEDPELIIEDMLEGLTEKGLKKTIRVVDREEAIKTAVLFAEKDDLILVAGKGHEKYQEIKGKRFPFDDKEKLSSFLL